MLLLFADRSHRRAWMIAFVCAALLGGCSSLYYDRRQSVSSAAGDAVATNEVSQTVDIWPEAAGYRNITSDGQKMQSAIERYRTNKVTPPQGIGTSSVNYQQSTPPATAPTPTIAP